MCGRAAVLVWRLPVPALCSAPLIRGCTQPRAEQRCPLPAAALARPVRQGRLAGWESGVRADAPRCGGRVPVRPFLTAAHSAICL